MGKRVFALVMAVVMLFGAFSLSVFAETVMKDGDWSYSIAGGGAKIISYTGSQSKLIVPEKIGGYYPKSVAGEAFKGSAVTVLSLCETIQSVESNAFVASSIKAVYIPKSASVSDSAANKKLIVFGFSGTGAETFASTNAHDFIAVAESYQFDSYVGKSLRINTKHAFTLSALDAKSEISGRYIKSVKAGVGKVGITFTNGIFATLRVVAKQAPKSIAYLPAVVNLYVSDSKTLTPSISNGDYPKEDFKYKSYDKAVATIDANGKITAVAPGSTNVLVAYNAAIFGVVPVNVGYAASELTLSDTELLLGVGESKRLTCTFGENEISKKITYTSSAPDIVAVSSKGKIVPQKVGVATITVSTYEGLSESCVVTVGKAPTKIKLAKSAVTMAVKEKITYKAKVDANAVCSSFIWRSGDTSIFTVDDNGNVTAKKAGKAKIYVYTYNYKSQTPYIRDSAWITVKKTPTSVAFNKTKIVLGVGEKYDLNVQFSSGADCYKKTITMSKPDIATIGKGIVVTGKKEGTTTITLTTFNGKTATCKVVVKPAPKKVACKPAKIKLSLQQSYQLKPYVNDGASCSNYTFKTTDKKVCVVSNKGLIKVKDYGECYIRIYAYNHTKNKPVMCEVKVNVGYITNKLEYYTTYFVETDYGKSQNIKMACKYINGNTDGYILQPGETFSFNNAVGPRNVSRGFTTANVIINGGYAPGIGGGICQCASTIFNATLFANLQPVERWEHLLKSGYVPYGRDATVCWGIQDYKFKNNYDTPIRLKMNYDPKGVLNCTIYSLEKIKLPKINLKVTYNNGTYRMDRYAGGKINYTCYSRYAN